MDWSKDGKVTISVIKYMYQVLDEFIGEINKTSATPSADYLFKIRENAKRQIARRTCAYFSLNGLRVRTEMTEISLCGVCDT